MKTLLLTGGTGFFGRSILDAFRRGLLAPFGIGRIVAVARHASRLPVEAPELCGAAIELVDADVLCLDSTFDADVLIHAAASSDAQRYRVDPAAETRIIVEGTRRVCELVRNAARRPRLLYVSSGAVYGRQPSALTALGEDAPPTADADPDKAAYAQAKRAAEAIVRDLADGSGATARIARCFAFVGPWLPTDRHFAIGNFIGNALRGEPIEVRARHPVIRSYLHADDLSVWLAAARDRGGRPVRDLQRRVGRSRFDPRSGNAGRDGRRGRSLASRAAGGRHRRGRRARRIVTCPMSARPAASSGLR